MPCCPASRRVFPEVDPTDASAPMTEHVSSAPDPSGPPSRQLILVVEDDRDISQILTAYLEQAGFRNVTALDGDTALAHVAQLKPDLALLDLRLPKRDGFSVLSALRVSGHRHQRAERRSGQAVRPADRGGRLSDQAVQPESGRGPRQGRPAPHCACADQGAAAGQSDAGREGPPRQRRGARPARDAQRISAAGGDDASPDRVHSRADRLGACLEDSEALERTIDSHVSNLRRKLVQAGAEVMPTTVRGVGYRLEFTT